MAQNRFRDFLKNKDLASRLILIVAVIGILFLAIILGGPKPGNVDDQSLSNNSTLVPTLQAKNNGLTPEELAEYSTTTGVLVGVIMVLAIVEIGTLIDIKFNQEDKA